MLSDLLVQPLQEGGKELVEREGDSVGLQIKLRPKAMLTEIISVFLRGHGLCSTWHGNTLGLWKGLVELLLLLNFGLNT